MDITVTSFKKSYVGMVALSAPDPAAGHCQPMPLLETPGHSQASVGQGWPAAVSGALSVAVLARDLLKEVTIIFITSTIVWSQVKQQGRNTALTINRKVD